MSDIDKTANKMMLTILVLQHPKATDNELRAIHLAQAKAMHPDAVLTPQLGETLAVVRDAVPLLLLPDPLRPDLLDEIVPACGKKLRDCTTTQDRQQAARWLAAEVVAAGPLDESDAARIDHAIELHKAARRKIN